MRWIAGVVVVMTVLVAPGVAWAGAAGRHRPPGPGTELWVSSYAGLAGGGSVAGAVAVSPVRPEVFVAGSSPGTTSGMDYAVVAYDTVTGAQLWASRYNGPASSADVATALAVSPDGRQVLITGYSTNAGFGSSYATVAYSAGTGKQLWAARYDGPAPNFHEATAIAVGPGGRDVFVTGLYYGARRSSGYATVAYDAATGARLWVRRYSGRRYPVQGSVSLAVSPRGGQVFVTGQFFNSYRTIAYSTAHGTRLWVRRYNGRHGTSGATAITVSPAGRVVYVTGWTGVGYDTVAYRATTGAQLWAVRYSGPGGFAIPVGVSAHSGRVYVTGSVSTTSGLDYATVAYNAATGAQLWASRYPAGAGYGTGANALAVSPAGGQVYVTGNAGDEASLDYATVAYDAATGAQLWVMRYHGAGDTNDYARAVAVSPSGGAVFVTGANGLSTAGSVSETVAYQG